MQIWIRIMNRIVPCEFKVVWDEVPVVNEDKPIKEPDPITAEDDLHLKYRGLDLEPGVLKEILLDQAPKHHFKLSQSKLEDLDEDFIYNAFNNIRAGVVPPEGTLLYRRPVVNKSLGNVFNNSLYCLPGYLIASVICTKLARSYDGATLTQYKHFSKAYKQLAKMCDYMASVIISEMGEYPETKTYVGAVKHTFTDGFERYLYVDKQWYESCGLSDEEIVDDFLNRLSAK